ncbi:anion permease [Halobacillus shinanisalinarum]|uniref:Anion permease n=1 Tax=Halobacillus shinanisalinarum TaxID=2932258 RepID=A0ABY4GUY0_9BACI|nr:SLC13 family permease [Halobacillus shinanisalinarum]UOQ91975.1 anion permease [Halobacillus shinanisalinarum]
MREGLVGYTRNNKWIHKLIDIFSRKSSLMISVHILFFLFVMVIDDLDYQAKVSLVAFLSAMMFWITTKIPAGFVAVTVIVVIVLLGAADAELLYQSLAQEVVWLMIGAFVMGEAVRQSGLAERFSRYLLNKSDQKSNMLFLLTNALFVSAFFIPSTSGRAALSMPIIKQLSERLHSSEERGVLALVAPVIILMSTSATLIGAGSHLIGISLLESATDQSISYIQWLIWGLPFTIMITLMTYFITKWILWPRNTVKEVKSIPTEVTSSRKQPMNVGEKRTFILISLMMLAWMSHGIHGYDIGFITMVGGLLFMIPKYGVISWKQGMKAVSWPLVLFVAAATALGKVLVDTGVVGWIEGEMLNVLHLFISAPEWIIVCMILLVAVTSHLYIHSHTTRAIIFVPSLILFSESIGLDSSTVVFLSLIGMNYCVTFPVSSKALLIFYEEGELSFDPRKLFKISAILMPLYILVMLLFYFTYWQWTGMNI